MVLAGSETFLGEPGLNAGGPLPGEANLFELLRYAAQSIYAPQRLIAPLPGVKKSRWDWRATRAASMTRAVIHW